MGVFSSRRGVFGLVPAVPDKGDRRKPAFFSFRRTVFGLCRLFRAEETDENRLSSHFVGLCLACAGCSEQRRPTKTGFLLISSDCVWLVQAVPDKGDRRKPAFFSFRRTVFGLCRLFRTKETDENRLSSHFVGLCLACAGYSGQRRPTKRKFSHTVGLCQASAHSS